MKSFKKEAGNKKSVQSKSRRTKFTSFFTKEYFLTYENFSYSNIQVSSKDSNTFNYFILFILTTFIAIGYDFLFEQFNTLFGLSSLDLISDILPIDNLYNKHNNQLLIQRAPVLKNLKIFTFLGLN